MATTAHNGCNFGHRVITELKPSIAAMHAESLASSRVGEIEK